jgi:hypothetical protein
LGALPCRLCIREAEQVIDKYAGGR